MREQTRQTRRLHAPLVAVLLCALLPALSGCGPTQAEIKKSREQAEYHYKLAYGHYFDPRAPNAEAALQEVLEALRLDPASAESHMLAGLILMGREQHLMAIDHFQKALAIQPDFLYAQNNLGTTYLALERWDDAIAIYEKLAANIHYDRKGVAQNNLGWAYYKKGQLDRARRYFLTATELEPQLCPGYNNLGMTLIDLSRNDEAMVYLQRGLKRCPAYAEPYYHLGRVKAEAGDLQGAREHFAQCARLVPETSLGARCQSRLAGIPLPPPRHSYEDRPSRAPEIVP